ncbi:uncharacterized protein LOC129004468 [Macrosteles quadrilineatus]|uniref:uncharacterized protein LOC129004468 n=1 Tax=Macrosteles quadrilineatus TaxID=74068 RepID=UPI0023E0996E|nr:uncharacterized protein LOC129004468 [Macrosteles quadrilineatus]
MLWATLFLINGASFVGSMPSAGSPENITIMFLSPTSVKVSWHTSIDHVEKYDVTYKPTDARVVAVVAGNSDSVTLSGLMADTQYQITVTAVRDGKKYKSRPIVFRTLELPRTNEVQITPPGVRGGGPRGVPPLTNMPPTYIQVRGVEVGIVVLVLMVWVAAIILFFNRWGKIRMLLPYQPDYKETQLKVTKVTASEVPGTGACAAAQACQSTQGNTFCCSQICSCPICSKRKFSCGGKPFPVQEEGSNPQEKQDIFDTQRHLHHFGMDDPVPGWRSRLSRSRINSAVYIAHSSAERDPLVPPEHAVTMRRTVSAGNLRERDHDSRDCDFTRQDSEPAGHRFELPVLSISEASEKPFVEQHL